MHSQLPDGLKECKVSLKINKRNKNLEGIIYIKPILEHYECSDAIELTTKIRNLEQLSSIYTPMVCKNDKFYCDIKNRYITEDIYIGIKYIIKQSNIYSVSIPKIKEIYDFFLSNNIEKG